ncbi:MAG: hypothetical protein ACLTV6_15015 [Christensenellales bacterium]
MKKWMILAAAILVVLGIGFAVKGASDRKSTVQPSETALPEATAEPEQAVLTDETQTEDDMTQVYMLHGQITEITDEYLMLEGTEQGTVQVNLLDDTLYDGAIQQSELAVGQYAEVLYDGKLTRSIPAQAAALAVNIYPLAGTVDEVQEDGRVLVTPTDGGAQVLLSLPDDVTVEAGETATFYTTGVATMSLPAQMNAIGVVK